MTPDPDQELADVLCPVSGWMASLPALSRAMAARFVTESLVPGRPAPPFWVCPQLDLRLRLQLTVTTRKTILVIFHRNAEARAVFKAETLLSVSPLARALPPVPDRVAELRCRLVLPRFMLGRETNPVRWQIGPGAEDILEVMGHAQDPERPRLRFRGRTLDSELWPLGPFLELTRTIRDWLAGRLPDGPETAVLPLTEDEPHEGRQILHQLLEAWRLTQEALSQAEPCASAPSRPSLADCLATPCGLTAFASSVVLRVRPDGTVAKANDDDTIQLRLELVLQEDQGGWQVRLTVHPPDFLIEGAVFDAVRDAFAWHLRKDVEKAFTKAGVPASRPEIQQLIRSRGDGPVVFRVRRRGETDTDLLVLTGELSGRRVALLLLGDFEFARDGSGRIEDASRFRTLYAGPLAPEVPVLDQEAQQWLLRLAVAARAWMWVLP